MEKIHVVGGPPGTGKTTYASILAHSMIQDGHNLMICSFSKAAAYLLNERLKELGSTLSYHNVGTLHSLAYRALGRPRFYFEVLEEWNSRYPHYKLSAGTTDLARHEQDLRSPGQALLDALDRARMTHSPNEELKLFEKTWETFKRQHQVVDFADIIEQAQLITPEFTAIIVDEAQDLSPAEVSLLLQWSKNCEHLVLIGDDDQCIYQSLKGASPTAFLMEGSKEVLSYSKRLGPLIKKLATKVLPKNRWNKDFEADPHTTTVRIIDHDAALAELDHHSMYLAHTNLQVNQVAQELLAQNRYFHNPYKNNRHLNPIGVGVEKRLKGFLGEWNAANLSLWSKDLPAAEVYVRGGKTALAQYLSHCKGESHLTAEQIEAFFQPEAFLKLKQKDVSYFLKLLDPKAAEIYNHTGFQGPILGTIHSVKGGEAAKVVVNLQNGNYESEDEMRRLLYVAMTRAKEELVLIESPGSLWQGFLEQAVPKLKQGPN